MVRCPEGKWNESGVHIHVPAGATPKDGPSAGLTIATALASLYTGHAVKAGLAMTGEITLAGLIFPVGGIKEKILAAHRGNFRSVILPSQNRRDLRDIPESVRKEMSFFFVERLEEAWRIAIPELFEPVQAAVAV